MATIKQKQKIISVGEDVEKLELSYTAGGDSALKRNNVLIHEATWMNFQNIVS